MTIEITGVIIDELHQIAERHGVALVQAPNEPGATRTVVAGTDEWFQQVAVQIEAQRAELRRQHIEDFAGESRRERRARERRQAKAARRKAAAQTKGRA